VDGRCGKLVRPRLPEKRSTKAARPAPNVGASAALRAIAVIADRILWVCENRFLHRSGTATTVKPYSAVVAARISAHCPAGA
jgi:hypothetical protein